MAEIQPPDLFPGYELVAAGGTVTAQSICIPLSILTGLTAVEANANTGDGRKVSFGISGQIFRAFNALSTADRPTKMSVTRGTPTGVDGTTIRQSYTCTYDLDTSISDVSSET